MIERMRMFSVWPGTPGRRQQNPRMIRSMGTPAFEASHKASIMSGSSSWFILAMMRAGCPRRLLSISRWISSRSRGRMVIGATRIALKVGLIGMAGQIVEEIDDVVGDAGSQVKRPTSA